MFTEVQTKVFTNLSQVYDPSLRSFVFQDYQLTPTLEEFERILDLPLKGKSPYRGIGYIPKVEDIANALKINVQDLVANVKRKGNVKGFLREYLEGKT